MSWLTDGNSKQRCCYFKRRRERFMLFPSPLFSFSFFGYVSFSFCSCLCVFFFQLPFLFLFRYRLSPLALTVPLLYLSQSLSPISSFPVFFFFILSVPFLFILFFFFSLFPLFSPSSPRACWCQVVFIGQRERGRPYCCAWGAGLYCPATASGWLASGHGWQGATPPVSHHEGAWGFGFWQSTRHEGVNEERRKKIKLATFPCCTSRGRRRRNSVAQNDTVMF